MAISWLSRLWSAEFACADNTFIICLDLAQILPNNAIYRIMYIDLPRFMSYDGEVFVEDGSMTDNIRQESLAKSILRLAIPVSLQQLFTASLHLVDTAMVAQLGKVSTAAIGAAGRWFFLCNLFYFGFASGMAVLVSQYWGVKDEDKIRKSFGLGIINAAVIGLIFSLASQIIPKAMMHVFIKEPDVVAEGVRYMRFATLSFVPLAFSLIISYLLRSTERVILPLVTSFVSVAVNTVLNYVLIFGKLGFPAMGIQGAGVATAISSVLQAVLIIVVCIARKSIIATSIKNFIPRSKEFIAKYYRVSSPVLINEVLWALGFNAYCMVLGRQGSANYAAYTIFASVEQIAFTLFVGVCSSCAVLVGKRVGSGRMKEAYDVARKFMIGVPVGGLIVGVIFALSSGGLVNLLNVPDIETGIMTQRLMIIYGGVMVMFLVPYIAIVGIFRAGGDTKIGLLYDLTCMWLVGVPAVYLAGMVFHWPFEVVFGTMYVESLVKTVLCVRHFKKKTWLIRLTG